jgi:hypothetical protein
MATNCYRSPALQGLAPNQTILVPLVGLSLWLTCTIYVHANDDILLLPLVAILIGIRGHSLPPLWLLAGILGSLAATLLALLLPTLVLPFLLVVLLLVLIRFRPISSHQIIALALPALVVLPWTWDLTLNHQTLTPIAAVLIAVAGCLRFRETQPLDLGLDAPLDHNSAPSLSPRTLVQVAT